MTPLHLAAERARVKVVNYLADKEANIINIQDWDGVNNVVCDCTDDERWSSTAYLILVWHHFMALEGKFYAKTVCRSSNPESKSWYCFQLDKF